MFRAANSQHSKGANSLNDHQQVKQNAVYTYREYYSDFKME